MGADGTPTAPIAVACNCAFASGGSQISGELEKETGGGSHQATELGQVALRAHMQGGCTWLAQLLVHTYCWP